MLNEVECTGAPQGWINVESFILLIFENSLHSSGYPQYTLCHSDYTEKHFLHYLTIDSFNHSLVFFGLPRL